MPMPPVLRSLLAAVAVAGLLAACRPAPSDPDGAARSDLSRPSLAVQALTRHMRSGDFAAFARDAVPPALHARLQIAWQAGDTRWPLVFTFIGFLMVRIPFAYLLALAEFEIPFVGWQVTGFGMGVQGAWWAMAADVCVRCCLMCGRFLQGGWKRVQV